MAGFDRIARPYRWLEYASFGGALQRCRCARLAECAGARRALVYGDGDGRFLARLLRANPAIEVEAVDSSAAMLGLLGGRAARAGAAGRLRLHHADARRFRPPAGGYDLVVTHFFLDCFSEEDLEAVLERAASALAEGGGWLLSEFAIPPRPLAGAAARLVVGGLYRAFGWLAGLGPRRLPDYAAGLRRHGLERAESRESLGGLLRSECWRLRRVPAAPESPPPWPAAPRA